MSLKVSVPLHICNKINITVSSQFSKELCLLLCEGLRMTGVNEHTLCLSNRSRLKETVSMKNKNKRIYEAFFSDYQTFNN